MINFNIEFYMKCIIKAIPDIVYAASYRIKIVRN